MIHTNTLLVSLFSPAQIVAMVLVAVLLVLLIALNLYMMYLNHKRGEHKMHTKQLQQQRDALMDKLAALRSGTYKGEQPVSESKEEKGGEENKKALAPKKEDDEHAEEGDSVGESDELEDQETEVEVDESGKVIRYDRSFTARIIQSSDEIKGCYSELKNYLLSFENIRSQISWQHEIFMMGKKEVAMFKISGTTLCLYLATDPKMFKGTKYLVEDLSVNNKKNSMPCMYRIKSESRVRSAKDIIDIVMAGFNTVQREVYMASDFVMPYETTQALINRKLIKNVGNDLDGIEREDAIAATKGIRYDRSFQARLLQSDDELKANYSKIKNYLLAHSGMAAKTSWKNEFFHRGKSEVAALIIRGKSLCLCLAGNPKNLDKSKFKFEDLSLKNPETAFPILYQIDNSRNLTSALQLIDRVLSEAGIGKIERIEQVFDLPFTATDTLIEKGLIKVSETKRDQPLTQEAGVDEPDTETKALYVAKDKSVVVVEEDATSKTSKKK